MIEVQTVADLGLSRRERDLLHVLFRKSQLTQGQLARQLGVTQQSTSRLVASLMEKDLLVEGERLAEEGKRGYPSTAVRLQPNRAISVGVSIMADAVSIALMDLAGDVLEERFSDEVDLSYEGITRWLERSLEEMLEAAHSYKEAILLGMGVGITGSRIKDAQGFNTPHSLEEWWSIDIPSRFSEKFGIPVWADNDGNVATLGESLMGVGRTVDSFAYVYIATGVGGGLCLDGQIWRGRWGNAGEYAGGLPPNIYPFPNLELLRQLASKDGEDVPTISKLIEKFDPSWPAISEWISRVRDSVSIIASNASAILDLETIVLGGRIPRELSDRLIPAVEFFDQRRRSIERPHAKLVAAATPGDATSIGAAAYAMERSLFSAQ